MVTEAVSSAKAWSLGQVNFQCSDIAGPGAPAGALIATLEVTVQTNTLANKHFTVLVTAGVQ
jgi:hypothetical protein